MRFFTHLELVISTRGSAERKDWHEWTSYRQEVTDYLSMMSGKEVYIGVFVGNYDKEGMKLVWI